MNILYLAHRIPFPPNKGDKLRAFRHLRHLAKNHCVWCACFVDDSADAMCAGPLSTYCHDLAVIPLNRTRAAIRGMGKLMLGGTITEGFYGNRAMRRQLREWSAAVPFDVVVAFSSSMATYALEVRANRRVLDLCDVDSAKWLDYAEAAGPPAAWIYRTEGRRLARLERQLAARFDAVAVISPAEALLLDGPLPGAVRVITNGVDLPTLAPGQGPRSMEVLPDMPSPHRRSNPKVGFVGVMDYRPNVDAVTWFVRECWPGIRAEFPAAEFRIVGRNPTKAVRELARTPGVFVVGAVDLVSPELETLDVFVAPLRLGRGLPNKVLEAMAHAKPVVMTSVANRGIGVGHGREAVICDDPAAIGAGVRELLRDEALRRSIGSAGRRFVAEQHCWDDQLRLLERMVLGDERDPLAAPPRELESSDGGAEETMGDRGGAARAEVARA